MECLMFDKRLDEDTRMRAAGTVGQTLKKVHSGNICSIGTAQ